MATRRISAAYLASTGRNALLGAAPARTRQHFVAGFQCLRQLQTTAIRYEQQQANTKAKRDPAPKIIRGGSKVYTNADEAVADLKSGSTILSAGFGLCGTAGNQPPYNSFK